MSTSASYYSDYDSDDLPSLNTVADYINDARTLLQDTLGAGFRYLDSELLVALNVTLLETRRIRPDLFVYNHRFNGMPQVFQNNDLTLVDLEPQFRLPVLHGLVAHALERDQEDYQDARVTAFMGFFYGALTGKSMLDPMKAMAGGSGPGRA